MKISYSQGRQNKIHISVDGEYRFTVDAEYWFLTPYSKMTEITGDEECDRFLSEAGSRYAYISALRILSYGDNSRLGLFRKLREKGHNPEYIENALDELERLGFVDDYRYAKILTERIIAAKHPSVKGLKSQLAAKGISSDIIEDILEETEIDEREEIFELLKTKYRRYLSDEKGVKKTLSALARLGYSWSDIRSAISEYIEEEEIPQDD